MAYTVSWLIAAFHVNLNAFKQFAAQIERVVSSHLYKSTSLFSEFIIMFDLHGNSLITIDRSQFNICSVRHVECTKEVSRSDTGAGSHSHHGIETNGSIDVVGQVMDESLAIITRLCGEKTIWWIR